MKLLPEDKQNMCGINYEEDKMSSYRTNDIETLLEKLGSLKITKKASEETINQSDKEMSIIPALMNKDVQVTVLKSIVLNLE